MRNSFKVFRQFDQMDCGPTCLKMVANYYGKIVSIEKLREDAFITREGATLQGLIYAAERIGMQTIGCKISFNQLVDEAVLPCILYWNEHHFVVLPPQNRYTSKKNKIIVADPAHGLVEMTKKTFLKSWLRHHEDLGVVLFLNPMPSFNDLVEEKNKYQGYRFIFKYLKPFRKYIVQLALGLFAGSILALIAPFLTQTLVDFGINQQNVRFIYIILFSQLALFVGNLFIEIIRSWLLLHINSRVNITIVSDFLRKLMRLPIKYFDTKVTGDLMQRIADHHDVEEFLTGTSLTTLFSLFNVIVFSIVLGIYSLPILAVFFTGTAISIFWIILFMKRRKEVNYARFQRLSENQDNLFEMLTGMQEIKINDSEISHRWNWEKTQANIFKTSIKALSVTQYQTIGFSFFNQLKNILISFLSAKEVISGNITLGMMLSISYIIGLLNAPISQLLNFSQTIQDAKLSLDRLSEIHQKDDEENYDESNNIKEIKLESLQNIQLKNISFRYGSPSSPFILQDISLTIPFGKVTAIVGSSGSGKSTLMKLLLKFYEPTIGEITLGNVPFAPISAKWWWQQCGVVLTDGFIFSNSIARNITIHENIDANRLAQSAKQSYIEDFVSDLPKGFETKIGSNGHNLSSGQRQRILIARAIYKQPCFLFLDEATNTLDANSEKIIIQNLTGFYKGRTVVVIAHRLSTIKNADQIVVMEKGKISEIGTHTSLIEKQGSYYRLVKNQLEIVNI